MSQTRKEKTIVTETLGNGLQVIFLSLSGVEYVASRLLVPGAIVNDPQGQEGLSLVLSEMTSRGAGEYDSQSLATIFDAAGIQHSESSSLLYSTYRQSFLPDKLKLSCQLMTSLVMEPHLAGDALDPVRSLFLQDLEMMKQNPSRLALTELRQRYFPDRFNRAAQGTVEGLSSITLDDVKSAWGQRYGAEGSILSVAGKLDIDECRDTIKETLGTWKGSTEALPEVGEFSPPESLFIDSPGAQQQLVYAYKSAPHGHDMYYPAKVLTQILSGGMFGRLFIEVREKRGLCYSVFAQHSARLEYGTTLVYAGTTPERVDQTHAVIQEVLSDPIDQLSDEELNRAKANLVSQIVLGEESTASQASSNASDWALLGRIRALEEIKEGVLSVTKDDLTSLLEVYPFKDSFALTLGETNFGDWRQDELGI